MELTSYQVIAFEVLWPRNRVAFDPQVLYLNLAFYEAVIDNLTRDAAQLDDWVYVFDFEIRKNHQIFDAVFLHHYPIVATFVQSTNKGIERIWMV